MQQISILGISAYYHDSAAALIIDGEIIAAAQEERFSGKKGDRSFPAAAVSFCLEKAKKSIDEIDYIVFYEDSVLKFERILTSSHLTVPKGFKQYIHSVPDWITDKIRTEHKIKKELNTKKIFSFVVTISPMPQAPFYHLLLKAPPFLPLTASANGLLRL